MGTFDAINQRRSVKAFDPSRQFTAAKVIVGNRFA
jgi:hypothetical protein